VAGDRWYGGAPAPRLMLHAHSLQIAHPITAESLSLSAPVPPEFEEWMRASEKDPRESKERLSRLLEAAVGSRWALAHAPSATTAFRLLHGDTEGLPGCAVDRYGDYLVLHSSSEKTDQARPLLLEVLAELGPRGIYYKKHPKQSNTLVDPRAGDLAPAHAIWGEDAADPLCVVENGIRYLVRLGDGLKTGIFLDQRDNRRRIQSLSPGKSVLNLFAYTCAFTVAAAVGGAVSTVSVDASAGALAWGEQNLAANALPPAPHKMVVADVFGWLRRAAREGQKFDIAILDPPSYATTHSSRFVAESDYPKLAAEALALLARGGRLLACTNHRRISLPRFRRFLHEAARLSRCRILQLKDLGLPPDFPEDAHAGRHLKSLLVTLA
jgi:23S rRNA (cytosine1962-C5)-methyltransferase